MRNYKHNRDRENGRTVKGVNEIDTRIFVLAHTSLGLLLFILTVIYIVIIVIITLKFFSFILHYCTVALEFRCQLFQTPV